MAYEIDPETGYRLYDATHLRPGTPSKYPPEATEGLTMITDNLVLIGDEDVVFISYPDPATDELLTNMLPIAEVASLSDAIESGADRWVSMAGKLKVRRGNGVWQVTFGQGTAHKPEDWWSMLVTPKLFIAMLDAFKQLAAENL